jgi:hypothetical protein
MKMKKKKRKMFDNTVRIVLYMDEDNETILDVDSVWLDGEDAIQRCYQIGPHVLIRERKINPSSSEIWDRRKDQFTQHELHARMKRTLDILEKRDEEE